MFCLDASSESDGSVVIVLVVTAAGFVSFKGSTAVDTSARFASAPERRDRGRPREED